MVYRDGAMKELGPATEHEMVLAFLQAEIDSPRWSACYAAGLRRLGATRVLIDAANLGSAQENQSRIALLGLVRGYRVDTLLFAGFPSNVVWRRVVLDATDFGLLRFANLGPANSFIRLSRDTRRVVDAAANLNSINTPENAGILAVVAAIRASAPHPPLIAAESGGGNLLLIEGYTRATAHAYVGTPAVEFYVGISPDIRDWRLY
jgi:hypothetical protein